MTRTFDFSALTGPARRRDVRAFRASHLSKISTVSSTAGTYTPLFVVALCALFSPLLVSWIVKQTGFDLPGTVGPNALFLIIAWGIVAIVALVTVFTIPHRRYQAWKRRLRLSRFAQWNQLSYREEKGVFRPHYPGILFDLGQQNVLYDTFQSKSGRALEIGNYRYEDLRNGRKTYSKRWGYIALRLDRNLPNMLLDARSNKGLYASGMKTALDKSQVLLLEGDFNKYFTLYCPKEYETDALYVFTPDLMALLIDNATRFDIEIIDNTMFFYSDKPFDFLNPKTWTQLLRIADTVGTKAISQTDYYADDRTVHRSANTVASRGRRLRPSKTPTIIASIVLILLAGWAIYVKFFPIVAAQFFVNPSP